MIEKPKRPKKIPNQDNKQPQTIQELIRRYDLDNTKVYDFLDELVGSLKETQTVVIPKEPTGDNREKVWLQKGKNLFNGLLELGTLDNTGGFETAHAEAIRNVGYIKVKPNTTYTISNNNNYAQYVYEYDENRSFIQYIPNTESNFTFTTTSTTRYIKFRTKVSTVENDLTTLFQIEQGENATEYEAYVEPVIYVKNDNGIYEEFIRKEEGITIYRGETTGNITLSEDSSTFKYMEIFYVDTYSNKQNSKKIDLNISKNFILDGMSYNSHISQNYSTSYVISGTSITVSSQVAFSRDYSNGAISGDISNNLVKILKVVGYR